MTAGAYPRKRVEDVLIKGKLPASYRIIPRQHLDTPLGVEPADSRFCTQSDGYAILYATPDFAAAFIEVIVRDRFARKKHRDLFFERYCESTLLVPEETIRQIGVQMMVGDFDLQATDSVLGAPIPGQLIEI